MDYVDVVEQNERVDRDLFNPLREYLQKQVFDPNHIKQYIGILGFPTFNGRPLGQEDHYYGFVLEAFVKFCLLRYAQNNPLFNPSKKQGKYGKLNVKIAKYGSFLIDYGDREYPIELDAVFEYGLSDIIPIIFEITFNIDKSLKTRFKRRLVEDIYEINPYLCQITPESHKERRKITKKYKKNPFKRKIVIPNDPGFSRLARELYEENRKKGIYSRS